jgi:hypothetical protein
MVGAWVVIPITPLGSRDKGALLENVNATFLSNMRTSLAVANRSQSIKSLLCVIAQENKATGLPQFPLRASTLWYLRREKSTTIPRISRNATHFHLGLIP